MGHVQQWPAASSAATTGTVTRTGTVTTAGNSLVLAAILRQSDPLPTVAITDNGTGNTWEQVGTQVAGSAWVVLYVCRNASPITSVTATFTSGGSTPAVSSTLILTEMDPLGAVVDTDSALLTDGGQTPALTATAAGQVVVVVAGAPVSNRTWTPVETGVDVTPYGAFASGQIHLLTADGVTTSAGDLSAGWTLATGSTSVLAVVGAVFAGPPPEPEILEPVSATGLSPIGAATLLEAVTDGDVATYGETGDNYDGTFVAVLPPIEEPADDFAMTATLSTSYGTATVTASLSADGATWTDAASPLTAGTTPTDGSFSWPPASLAPFDATDWAAGMRVRLTFAAA